VVTKTKAGRPIVELHIITGKGLNSARKKSVLKPAIQELCKRLDLAYENTEGGVIIRIPI
jgi:DNA-nicking Smr family endonuclease